MHELVVYGWTTRTELHVFDIMILTFSATLGSIKNSQEISKYEFSFSINLLKFDVF